MTQNESACVYVVQRPGSALLDLAEVRRFFAEHEVANCKTPERVEIVDSLPMTSSDKVRKVECGNGSPPRSPWSARAAFHRPGAARLPRRGHRKQVQRFVWGPDDDESRGRPPVGPGPRDRPSPARPGG